MFWLTDSILGQKTIKIHFYWCVLNLKNISKRWIFLSPLQALICAQNYWDVLLFGSLLTSWSVCSPPPPCLVADVLAVCTIFEYVFTLHWFSIFILFIDVSVHFVFTKLFHQITPYLIITQVGVNFFTCTYKNSCSACMLARILLSIFYEMQIRGV